VTRFTIKRLGHQGDAIADGPDGDVYVAYALPGETVEGVLVANRVTDPRITVPSADRVKAPCSHFKTCGGCALQHASDSFLADWKVQIVKTALAAHQISAPFLPTLTSPAQSRRRASFAGRRTKKGVMVGFHAPGSEAIIAIPGCVLLHPEILKSMPALEALTRIGATRSVAVTLSVTHSPAGLDVDVKEAKPADGPMLMALGSLTEQHKLARLSWNGEVIAARVQSVALPL